MPRIYLVLFVLPMIGSVATVVRTLSTSGSRTHIATATRRATPTDSAPESRTTKP